MGMNPSLTMHDERTTCAQLRDTILRVGRQIGWPSRTAITFTEQCARRPWKRCTSGQLWTVLAELDAVPGGRGGSPSIQVGVVAEHRARSTQKGRYVDHD